MQTSRRWIVCAFVIGFGGTSAELRAEPSRYAELDAALGYGHFEYAGVIERDGGSTVSYPPEDASGIALAIGGTFAWRVAPSVYIGLTAHFEPLLAPSGQIKRAGEPNEDLPKRPGIMVAGTGGGALVYTPSDQLAVHADVVIGGGGVAGLPGGVGLQIHGVVSYMMKDLGEQARYGLYARGELGPLMTDSVRGGSITYLGIVAGAAFRMR